MEPSSSCITAIVVHFFNRKNSVRTVWTTSTEFNETSKTLNIHTLYVYVFSSRKTKDIVFKHYILT